MEEKEILNRYTLIFTKIVYGFTPVPPNTFIQTKGLPIVKQKQDMKPIILNYLLLTTTSSNGIGTASERKMFYLLQQCSEPHFSLSPWQIIKQRFAGFPSPFLRGCNNSVTPKGALQL
ncbi:hypothetical protein CDAR_320511 [Caerostris darwini]|uniref:Uncharacterized protein n=1 Tax=Caerostris darwini TaxID=1538125 RepID=A0AAV4X0P7_9ARAC|nr:hypothetical protein CDAR_320511 [Caerostris darwini]